MSVFAKIASSSLREQIADRLREAILDGTLPEGERLVERKLAADFGASLTAVREALVELESDGFIAKMPNSSTHVIRLSLEDVEKIVSVRAVLEGYAVEMTARKLTMAQAAALMSLCEEIMSAAAEGDYKRLLHKDLVLHETIWQFSGNEPMLPSLRRLVHPAYAFFAIRFRSCSRKELTDCAEANLPLLAAICSKDADSAKSALHYALQRWV
jgi:DNA-binding GntR family transcriptional regulator